MKGMLDVGKQFSTLRILLATSRVSPARRGREEYSTLFLDTLH